jgi:hypothetical protein
MLELTVHDTTPCPGKILSIKDATQKPIYP